jgi:hypothetical protein
VAEGEPQAQAEQEARAHGERDEQTGHPIS